MVLIQSVNWRCYFEVFIQGQGLITSANQPLVWPLSVLYPANPFTETPALTVAQVLALFKSKTEKESTLTAINQQARYGLAMCEQL